MSNLLTRKIPDSEKQLNIAANNEIKRNIKGLMLLNNLTTSEVAEELTKMGRPITERGLTNKISSGKHQTVWYWDLLKIINKNTKVDLNNLS